MLTRTKGRAAIALVIAAVRLRFAAVAAQQRAGFDEELRRIYERGEYRPQSFGPAAWWEEGRRYTTVEPSAADNNARAARDIVAYDTATGRRDVLVPASMLTPANAAAPLAIDGYTWSRDRSRLLLFTSSVKVWRDNTRGDYWVLDVATKRLRQLGGTAAPSSLMFAKFSPDGTRVGYVRDNDIYVEDLDERRDHAGSPATDPRPLINGTSDWVYEEELRLRDCFRWSPDGSSIAYWQFDSSGVEHVHADQRHRFALSHDHQFPYPKVGHDELRGPHRRGQRERRADALDETSPAIRATSTWRAWTGSAIRDDDDAAAQPAPEHATT